MIFNTYGNKNKEAMLLIHPMFTSKDFFMNKIELLSKNHYLIIPTLSGHYSGSIYKSIQEEMDSIDRYLEENEIRKIDYIVGFSLGGNIAYHYFCTHTDSVSHAIIDSAPLFEFPSFVKKFFYQKYKKCLLKIKHPNTDIAKELNKCFNGMGEEQKSIAPSVDLQSLDGLIESCYNIKLYDLNSDVQHRLTFIYGNKDIARLCLPRIMIYKHAKVVRLKEYDHCGFFMFQTGEYRKEFLS